MALAYYASKISDNILATPGVAKTADSPAKPGFLIAKDAVIARTGWQTYQVRDLPQERAEQLGVDTSDPGALIELYRSPEEVFNPATIASFEGMTVTDNHPQEFVSRHNWRDVAMGHIQNVRKGPAALDSGDWPLIGDIVITADPLITEVETGAKRELSCGYDFEIERDGKKIVQVGILGNHVALVPKGRAGAEARINDALPSFTTTDIPIRVSEQEVTASRAADPSAVGRATGNSTKEKTTVKATDRLRELLGLGLKAKATDATPEELVEYSEAAFGTRSRARDADEEEKEKEKKGEDSRRAADMKKKADDEAEAEKEKEKKAEDAKRMKDSACKPGEEGHKSCTEDKCMAKDKAKDAQGSDKRARMHALLDARYDQMESKNSEDADMEELKSLFSEFLGEEEKEPEHAAADESEGAEVIEPVGEESEVMPANDAAVHMFPAIEKTKDKAVVQAYDAALDSGIEDERGFLMAIRPAVAKSKDMRVRSAFDAAIKKFTRSSRASNGSYTEFASATGRVGDRVADRTPVNPYEDLNVAYAKQLGRNPNQGGK